MFKGLLQKLAGSAVAERRKELPPVFRLSDQECNAILRGARKKIVERKYAECLVELDPLLRGNPEVAEVHFLAGKALYALRDFPAAAAALIKAAESGFSDPSSDAMIASALTEVGDNRQALGFALRAYEKRSTDPQICILVAQLYLRLEAYEQAADFYTKALELAPRSFDALQGLIGLNNRARVLLKKNLLSSQVVNLQKQYLKKMRGRLNDVSALGIGELLNLITLSCDQKDYFREIALPCADELWQRDGLDAAAALALANVFYINGDLPRAREMFELGSESVAESNVGPKMTLGQLYIASGGGKWREGWTIFDKTLLQFHASKKIESVPGWNGDRLGKKRLFVYQEQGFGDVLLGLRLLGILKQRGISNTFWVNPGLGDLLRSSGDIDGLIECAERPDPIEHGCSVAIHLFGLIGTLKLSPGELRQFSTIRAPGEKSGIWQKICQERAPGVRIGLVVTGNPWRSDDWMRSVPLDDLDALRKIEGVSWVSLAVDPRPERDAINDKFSALDLVKGFKDFSDTAAVIESLDAVVAIDCSVAHLAAAMGKPVFVLVPNFIDWRWKIGGDSSPWWPNAKTYCSASPGEWKTAVETAALDLAAFVASRR